MGPIERELRGCIDHANTVRGPSFQTWKLFSEARANWTEQRPGIEIRVQEDWADHMSEAIEAAEALKL
jgi:hypothetical protein